MTTQSFEAQLADVSRKLDRVIELLESKPARRPAELRQPRPKPLPLTEDEIKQLQARFQNLFARWKDGKELEVQSELEALNADALRRFADANNLNITAKTPKIKALTLIATRFREKRQLMQGLMPRRPADA
jgi:hypothetical protein